MIFLNNDFVGALTQKIALTTARIHLKNAAHTQFKDVIVL